MLDEKGNMWTKHPANWVGVTTNGYVKRDGSAVMGRGCAKEAALLVPDLPMRLGLLIQVMGNVPILFPDLKIITFPTKHYWYETSDLTLIAQSARLFMKLLDRHNINVVYLARPGCGNGGLKWEDVKPIVEPILDDRVIVVYL